MLGVGHSKKMTRCVAFALAVLAFLAARGETTCRDGRLIKDGMSQTDKDLLLYVHNDMRNQVASGKLKAIGQPSAENMNELVWDDYLAQTAQSWANQCVYQHSRGKVYKDKKPLGENLFISYSNQKSSIESPNLTDMVQKWFDEVKEFGYNGTFSKKSGHYSQIIWGGTKRVGCGISSYESKGFFYNYLVCNYHPAGNTVGELPYSYGSVKCAENDMFRSNYFSDLCIITKGLVEACQAQLYHWTNTVDNTN